MNLSYSELINYINKIVDVQNPCLICHQQNNKSIKLNCGHEYHIACINKCNKSNKECPYCGKKYNSVLCQTNTLTCTTILKSGVRKGQTCNRSNCKYH